MVNWKKDVKLSDLLARGKDDGFDREEMPFHEGETDQGSAADELSEVEGTDAEPTAAPFWKREIGFGRRKGETEDETETDPEVEASEDDPEKRTFFTRKLSFGREKEETLSDTDFDAPVDELEETTPFWKRQLRFGGQKGDAATESSVEHEFDQDEPEPVAQELFEEDVVEKKPFWKRELAFGRRQDEATPEDFELGESEQATEDPFEDPAEKTPFWKRGFAFSRRTDEATSDDFVEQPEEDPFEADVVEKTPFWKRELRFGRDTETSNLDEDLDAEETDEATPFWKRELNFGRRKDDTMSETETPVEVEGFHHEEPEPVAAALPEPDPVASAFPEPDAVDETQWKDETREDTHIEDTPTPETSVELEQPAFVEPDPVAPFADAKPAEETAVADEADFASAEPLDETDAAPFWKREINFGRRRGDADLGAPVSVPQPPVDDADTFAGADTDSDSEGKRFWKRNLKFGRTKEEPSDADFDAPSESEKKPFFKVSLRRPKDPDFDAPKPEKRPFFKRELSFRREKDSGRQSSAGRATRGSRTKQVVGLKVGASQIAAARIVNNGSPELVQLARQSIEQGIVVGGELRDPDALAEALREFFANNKFPNRNVRLGIGNNRIGVRSFEISGVHDPKQLENAVRFRAQETLPIPLDEAVLDYQVLDESVSPTGIRTYRVLLVVAYRELIDRYVAACRGAGLRLVGIDLEAFALLRALSPPPSEGLPEDTALVAVSIGHDRSTFAVSNGTVCEFTRVLDWGGSALNTAIARALDITPSQAEPVKRTLSLNQDEEGAPAESNEHTIRAEEAVRLELQTFARELVSSLHFYQNQPGSPAIGNIALTGGTAHLPGLAAELQRLIGVKVRVGDPLRRVKAAKRVETPAQVGSMAVAIGLGIED